MKNMFWGRMMKWSIKNRIIDCTYQLLKYASFNKNNKIAAAANGREKGMSICKKKTTQMRQKYVSTWISLATYIYGAIPVCRGMVFFVLFTPQVCRVSQHICSFFVRDGHRTYAKFTCYKIIQHLARSYQNMISKMCSIIIVTSKKK